jgi:hypothetical protein
MRRVDVKVVSAFHRPALIAVPEFPIVEPGNELASMICDAGLGLKLRLTMAMSW